MGYKANQRQNYPQRPTCEKLDVDYLMKETYFYEKRRKGRNIPARCARFCGSSQSRNETHNNMLKEIYMHEKRRMKETYLRVEQGLVTLSIGTANTSQKRHIRTKREFGYLMEETCMYEKRHIRTKRDIYVRKETYTYEKRHMRTKRELGYLKKETYMYEKRHIYTRRDTQKDIPVHDARSCHSSKS